MNYFVTGATGFIGRFLLERLLKRDGTIYVLVRESSTEKFEALREKLGAGKRDLVPVLGDITEPGLVSDADRKKLAGKIDHFFHLAAVYDMGMSDATADRVNNEGTRNVVNFVNELGGDVVLHHASSVAVAGSEYVGRFTEKQFDVGQDLTHPYYRTKYQSEGIVRDEAKVPFRVYRPGMVVGASDTGEMDKIDGPYYFFKAIQRIRDRVPKWLPLLGIEGGRMPLAPVDYVASAMDHIAHQDGLDGKTFHLVQSPPPTLGEMLSTFFRAAHGPEFATQIELPATSGLLPKTLKQTMKRLPLDGATTTISKALGIPVSIFGYINNQAVFDDRQTKEALKGSGIACPMLDEYAEVLWSYWERYIDYDEPHDNKLLQKVNGKVVMITGASSGIGFAVTKRLAAHGAKVILVARTPEKLLETKQIIESHGGEAYAYPCDLNDMEAIDDMADKVLADFGAVDFLVNNAGRSIRRAVHESLDRFHDFERTMQLNYFGAIRLIMRLLPSMSKRKRGHIINISSIGCLANAPRFSAYVASKAALDAFSRCLSTEVRAKNINITTVYMPLVRTPMIAPTRMYDYVPTLSPDDAADLVVKSIVDKPKRVKTPLGQTAELSYALWPKVNDYFLGLGFQLFPSSAAARGQAADKPSRKGMALATLFPGQHW